MLGGVTADIVESVLVWVVSEVNGRVVISSVLLIGVVTISVDGHSDVFVCRVPGTAQLNLAVMKHRVTHHV